MDEFDRKVIAAFPGKSVRKDLTALMKKGGKCSYLCTGILAGNVLCNR